MKDLKLNNSAAPKWATGFILMWIAVQLLLPVSYYLEWREPHDERFAWRMFSPTRMSKCTSTLYVGEHGRARNDLLKRDLHQSWLGWIKRGRLTIAQRYMEHRCAMERNAGEQNPWVSMRLACPQPDGTKDVRISPHENACAPKGEGP